MSHLAEALFPRESKMADSVVLSFSRPESRNWKIVAAIPFVNTISMTRVISENEKKNDEG